MLHVSEQWIPDQINMGTSLSMGKIKAAGGRKKGPYGAGEFLHAQDH
jgi:hypothetical protein